MQGINQNMGTVTIIGIGSGSTIIDLLIDTSAAYGSAEIQQQQAALQNKVSQSIAGMSVTSFTIVINSNVQNNAASDNSLVSSSSNILIIMAIAIPAVLVRIPIVI
jgi:hypothetical protein